MKEEILTYDAKLFLNTLSNKFSTRITELLCNRENAKSFKPGFIHRTSDIRKSDWKVAVGTPDRSNSLAQSQC